MCLAQGHNAVTLVRLEPAAPRSRVKHSTNEPLRSQHIRYANALCMYVHVHVYLYITCILRLVNCADFQANRTVSSGLYDSLNKKIV